MIQKPMVYLASHSGYSRIIWIVSLLFLWLANPLILCLAIPIFRWLANLLVILLTIPAILWFIAIPRIQNKNFKCSALFSLTFVNDSS